VAAADDITVQVEGLAALRSALRRLDDGSLTRFEDALRIHGEKIAAAVRTKMPRDSGAAAGSVRVTRARAKVAVQEGDTRTPYVGWLDFGGSVGRRKMTQRPFMPAGRYLFPTALSMQADTTPLIEQAVMDAARGAGFEVGTDGA